MPGRYSIAGIHRQYNSPNAFELTKFNRDFAGLLTSGTRGTLGYFHGIGAVVCYSRSQNTSMNGSSPTATVSSTSIKAPELTIDIPRFL